MDLWAEVICNLVSPGCQPQAQAHGQQKQGCGCARGAVHSFGSCTQSCSCWCSSLRESQNLEVRRLREDQQGLVATGSTSILHRYVSPAVLCRVTAHDSAMRKFPSRSSVATLRGLATCFALLQLRAWSPSSPLLSSVRSSMRRRLARRTCHRSSSKPEQRSQQRMRQTTLCRHGCQETFAG